MESAKQSSSKPRQTDRTSHVGTSYSDRGSRMFPHLRHSKHTSKAHTAKRGETQETQPTWSHLKETQQKVEDLT